MIRNSIYIDHVFYILYMKFILLKDPSQIIVKDTLLHMRILKHIRTMDYVMSKLK